MNENTNTTSCAACVYFEAAPPRTRKNVQDSAALLVQCAAEVLQTFDEELDLEGDAPQDAPLLLV